MLRILLGLGRLIHVSSLWVESNLSLQIDLSRDAVSTGFLSRAFSSDLSFKAKVALGLEIKIMILRKSSEVE